jgi:hypothetical protein
VKPPAEIRHRRASGSSSGRATTIPIFYRFRFELGGKVIEGKVRTALPGVAAFRARRVISRKLKERSAK